MLQAFASDRFQFELPAGHRFPVEKYRLLRERIVAERLPVEIATADAATDEQLELVHERQYLRRLADGTLSLLEQKRIGFPWSLELVERSRRSTGATIAAARMALADGIGCNLAGGTHHAFADAGQGFCVFNDVAVAIRVLQAEGVLRRSVIIDLDVHQGNGTAAIFHGAPDVFTFSMHGARNYPFRKQQGDLDIALPDGTGDAVYLEALGEVLEQKLPLAAADCIFFLAGADPYTGDRLGRLKLSKAGLAERDRLVLSTCRAAGLPLVIVMAGGYALPITDTVEIHASTVRSAGEIFGFSNGA